MSDWKTLKPEAGRENLTKYFSVSNLQEAYDKAGIALSVLTKHNALTNSILSLNSMDLLIVLHSHTMGKVNEQDKIVAQEIDHLLDRRLLKN